MRTPIERAREWRYIVTLIPVLVILMILWQISGWPKFLLPPAMVLVGAGNSFVNRRRKLSKQEALPLCILVVVQDFAGWWRVYALEIGGKQGLLMCTHQQTAAIEFAEGVQAKNERVKAILRVGGA